MRTPFLTSAALLAVLLTSGCSLIISEPSDKGERPQQPEAAEQGGVSSPLGIRTCAGEAVTLAQDDTELILEGNCGVLTVTASRVSVNVESLAGLIIEGDQVGVIGDDIAGLTSVRGTESTVTVDALADVEVSGDGNTIISDEVESLQVSGSDNIVNWSSGTATGRDTGQRNTFVSP